jgi:hypothetical protein
LPPLVGSPDFVSDEISDPDAKVGGIGGEVHPLLALTQGLFGQPATTALNEERTDHERLHDAQGDRSKNEFVMLLPIRGFFETQDAVGR